MSLPRTDVMNSPTAERCRVFVVDNNQDLAWSLSELLSLEPDLEAVGHCSTGGESLAKARAARADVLLLDYRLPDCTAMQVLDEARASALNLGILIYSGYLADELAAEAMARGAAGYVTKGGSFEALAQEIRRVHRTRTLL
jgi:two-component system, NarL family, response regulator DevR